MQPKNVVVVFSGGLDSLVLLAHAKRNLPPEARLLALCFNYGQRAQAERKRADKIAKYYGVAIEHVEIPRLSSMFGSSSLTNLSNPELSGKSTVVPNRNTIFLMIAAAKCQSMGGGWVMYGAHLSTAGIYPDTTLNFVERCEDLLAAATEGSVSVRAPLILKSKTEVVQYGYAMQVPFEMSWSCYGNDAHHCGECYACQDRRQAFDKARIQDPTIYALENARIYFADSPWFMRWW